MPKSVSKVIIIFTLTSKYSIKEAVRTSFDELANDGLVSETKLLKTATKTFTGRDSVGFGFCGIQNCVQTATKSSSSDYVS